MVVEFHFCSAVLAEQNSIADLHVQGLATAIFAVFAFAYRHDLTLLGFFLCGIGNNDPSANLLAFFNSPHDDAVMKRPDIDCHTSVLLLSIDEFGHNLTKKNCSLTFPVFSNLEL